MHEPEMGPRFTRRCTAAATGLATAMGLWALTSVAALGHSWYPPNCCNENDCRKVDRIDYLPSGDLLMHFGGQQVVVPRGFEQLPSKDLDAHVCVYRINTGRWAPRCVFMPANA